MSESCNANNGKLVAITPESSMLRAALLFDHVVYPGFTFLNLELIDDWLRSTRISTLMRYWPKPGFARLPTFTPSRAVRSLFCTTRVTAKSSRPATRRLTAPR